MECKVCRRVKSEDKFTMDYKKGTPKTVCKECRAVAAKRKYAERKRKGLCPLCGNAPSMISSCMCESCWFIRNGPQIVWIEQGKKCPYTGTALVPGHNMRFVRDQWVSKRYAVASKGMDHEKFKEWCRIVADG